jgi:hypothetical protein
MARPSVRFISLALVSAVLILGVGAAPAKAGPEGSFASKINAARAAQGLDPVLVYWDLRDDARRHARDMADAGKVFKYPNIGSVTSGWKALGQVYGVGPSVNPLFNAFMSNSGQRSTILGPYNYVGVGAVTDSDGILWVSLIFMRGDDGLVDPPDTTTSTTSTTTSSTQPPSPTTTTPPATTTTKAPPGTTKPPSDPPATTAPPAPTTTLAPQATTTTSAPLATTTTAPQIEAAQVAAPTTTVAPTPVDDDRPPDLAAGTPLDAGGDGPLGGWMIFGVVALAGAVLTSLAVVAKPTRPMNGTGGTSVAAAAGFDACTNCGLIFNAGHGPVCPRCSTPR